MTDELREKIILKLEKIDAFLNKYLKPRSNKIEKSRPFLEGRIIFCGNCEVKRVLRISNGTQVCETCGSSHWAYPIQINFIHQFSNPKRKYQRRKNKCL